MFSYPKQRLDDQLFKLRFKRLVENKRVVLDDSEYFVLNLWNKLNELLDECRNERSCRISCRIGPEKEKAGERDSCLFTKLCNGLHNRRFTSASSPVHPHNPHLTDQNVHHNPVVDLLLDGYTSIGVAPWRIDTPRRVMERSGSYPLFQELQPGFINHRQFCCSLCISLQKLHTSVTVSDVLYESPSIDQLWPIKHCSFWLPKSLRVSLLLSSRDHKVSLQHLHRLISIGRWVRLFGIRVSYRYRVSLSIGRSWLSDSR
jgi:hypothetical protein